MITLIDAPMIPAHTPKMKYIVPMSLWFVDIIHRIYSFDKLQIYIGVLCYKFYCWIFLALKANDLFNLKI
jgi:hypothetical protein